MTVGLLVFLLLCDVGLVLAFYYLNRRQERQDGVLAEITEERLAITELRDRIKADLTAAEATSRAARSDIAKLAAEAELEVKNGGGILAVELEKFVNEFRARIEGNIKEISRKQLSLEKAQKKIEIEREKLTKTVGRAEKLAKFFSKNLPYEEVLAEIEDQKYIDARRLLTQGVAPKAVAAQLGMKESEMDILSSMAVR
jgi:hypothetical protein